MSWRTLARDQDGIVSRRQLREAGLSDTAITRLRAAGTMQPLHRGTYLVGGAPLTYRAQLWGAVCATSGVLGFATAAHLWGMVPEQPPSIEIVVDPARHVTVPATCRVHRVFVERSAVGRRDGLPTTTRR